MSEFRQDLLTGEWVIMAPERMKRPHPKEKQRVREIPPRDTCPFENPKKSGNWPPILSYPNEKNWEVIIFPNKYPAVVYDPHCAEPGRKGPFHVAAGTGQHDMVVTRDHTKTLRDLTAAQATQIFRLIQKRYDMLSQDRCLLYASALHNWGATAGASVYHPHYQIISLPVIPSFVTHSIEGSERYFMRYNRCAHCDVIEYERREKERVIEENNGAIMLASFTSRRPYEVRIFPKPHISHFEHTPAPLLTSAVSLLASALRRIWKYVDDPDLNFYIHSAPLKHQRQYEHYHWHIEILPNVPPPPGGFELGTGIEINAVGPEYATRVLQGKIPFHAAAPGAKTKKRSKL